MEKPDIPKLIAIEQSEKTIKEIYSAVSYKPRLTVAEAKARFQTVQSAKEMADLMLEMLRDFGPDITECVLEEIREASNKSPFLY